MLLYLITCWFGACISRDHASGGIGLRTPTQNESLLQSLEKAAGGIGFHLNAEKIEYTCFNQKGDISILNDGSLKLVDKFTYQVSSVSSTENDVSMRLTKAWTAFNRLSILWK